MHLCQRFFQSSKHFLNSISGIAFKAFFDSPCDTWINKSQDWQIDGIANKSSVWLKSATGTLLHEKQPFVGGMLSLNVVVQKLKMLNAPAGQMR